MALEAIIDGDITGLQKKIKEAELNLKELSKIKLEQIKLGLDTKEINGNIASVKKSLTDLKTVSKDTGNAISGMAPKVANGGNALMQFSRIAQDAPFGIMGIGNNITATVEAFGHLRQSTGSAGGALKAMAGSILGSGGILLAVSLVTTALTYMSQNNLSVGDVLDKLSGNFDNLKKAMQDVNNEAIKNSGAEIASMKALVSVAKDENITREERLAAVQKLQKEYPAYFGNLTTEQILSGNVESAVKAVTFALIQKSKAQILANRIAENDLKILQEQQKGQKLVADYTAGKGLFAILKGSSGMQAFKASADSASNAVDGLRKEQELLTKELEISTRAANTFEVANTKASKAPKKTKVPNVTPQVQGLNTPDVGGFGLIESATQLKQLENGVYEAENGIKTSLKRIPGYFNTAGQESILALQKLNDDMKGLIQGSLTQTFADLGNSIGTALAQGKSVFGAIGQSLLNSLGAFLSDMGKLLIQYGTLAIAKGVLDKAILIPGAGIVAGAAAIAVGVALSAAGGALSNRAKQGASGGSMSSGADYRSPASNVSYGGSSSGGSGGGNYVFEIQGTKLIGVIQNTLNSNRSLGGNLNFG